MIVPDNVRAAREEGNMLALRAMQRKAAVTRSNNLAIEEYKRRRAQEELAEELRQRDCAANLHICPLDD